jgi:hypothetical protein
MVVYGGLSAAGVALGDLHVLTVLSGGGCAWSSPSVEGAALPLAIGPSVRACVPRAQSRMRECVQRVRRCVFAQMTAWQDRLIVFGGRGTDRGRFADLFVVSEKGGVWTAERTTPSGAGPSGRYLHSAVLVPDELAPAPPRDWRPHWRA